MDKFLEDESLVINDDPDSKLEDKDDLEERRKEMLKDNRLEKYNGYNKKTKSSLNDDDMLRESQPYSYSRPKLKYFIDGNDQNTVGQKNSFKFFQAMTLGNTSDVESLHSIISAKGIKYKPKVFELLRKHSMQN